VGLLPRNITRLVMRCSSSQLCVPLLLLLPVLSSCKEQEEYKSRIVEECTGRHVQEALTAASICRPVTKVLKLPLPSNNSVSQMTPQFIEIPLCGGGCHNSRQSCVSTATKVRHVPVILSQCEVTTTGRCGKQCTTVEVEEDTACRCDCLEKQEKCPHPKHEFNRASCDCECRDKDAKQQCRDQGRVWSSERCVCSCPMAAIKPCSTGFVFDYNSTCSCILVVEAHTGEETQRVERSQEGGLGIGGTRGKVELIIITSLSFITAVFFLIILSLLQNIKKLKETIKIISVKYKHNNPRYKDPIIRDCSQANPSQHTTSQPLLVKQNCDF